MLLELTIRQFAIIKDLKVHFHQGLNILTGETGAGKSIIIDAIQLITGGRGSVEYIRKSADKAEIEALFDLSVSHPVFEELKAMGIESGEDGMLLLKRDLLLNGKSVCRINGQLVTLAMLKEAGEWLVQLHSQNQHQHLLFPDKQLALLDAYGEQFLNHIKKQFGSLYEQYHGLKKEAKSLMENEKELAHRIDLLQFQVNEISQASLKSGEDEELIHLREKFRHYEKIVQGLYSSNQLLSEESGAVDLLSQAVNILQSVSNYDPEIKMVFEQLSNAYYQIEDAAMQLNQLKNTLEFDPQQLNEIEERLSVLHHLKRKYGETVDAVLEYAASIEEELGIIQNRDEHLHNIEKKLAKMTEEIRGAALKLSKQRHKLAKELSKTIEQELKDLQMKNTKFQVDIYHQEHPEGLEIDGTHYLLTPFGLDKIQFLISPNPGEPLKPLHKIASGGELSRIMLAIQTILAHKDDIPTIIFDEIDTGVSGRAAQAIAEKLAMVSKGKQVFVITHLPQVASMADHHYLIQKNINKDTTFTEVIHLEHEERINEVARMLGGVEVTDLTKKHAKEMIEKTIQFKNSMHDTLK